jgi:hypothetical protein
MMYAVGETYKAKLMPGLPYKIHICAVVDDNQIVFKYYGRHKQWWHYRIEEVGFLEIYISRANKET